MILQIIILGVFLTARAISQTLIPPIGEQSTCPPITLPKGSAIYFQMLFGPNSVSYKMMFDRPLAELLGPYANNSTTQDEETKNYNANTMAIIICPFGQIPSESLFSFCKNGAWTPSFGTCEPMLPKIAGKLLGSLFRW